jgi:hypothetical protein
MLHHSRAGREQLALVLVVEQLGRVFFSPQLALVSRSRIGCVSVRES